MLKSVRCGLNLFFPPFCQRCRLKTTSTGSIQKVPLSKPLQDFPKIIYPRASQEDNRTKVTVLSNGLQVASSARFGQFCTVGVVVSSGSRYEKAFPSGILHFLEKLAFQSTTNYASKDEIWSDLEKHGGIVDCQGSRDFIVYAASIDSRGLETAVKIISDVCLRPMLKENELELARQTVTFELEDISAKIGQEHILLELIHAAAYQSNTLGLPKLCPINNINIIDRNTIMKFLRLYHTPDRMALAGVGVDHNVLVNLANRYFVEHKPIWEEDENLKKLTEGLEPDRPRAQYTGGIVTMEKDLSNINPGPSPMPELVHLVIGLESFSHKNLEDFIPICVLNIMMGGGGSFSAGGPGKGMYTRLYTNVLNRYHWMYNATASNHAYCDTGLFFIHSSAPSNHLRDLINVVVKELISMCGSISQSELNRAKIQLQSMLLMNLEARPVVFEDIARQVLENGFRKEPEFFIDKISKVTEEDVRRVASQMLKNKVSVAALGDLTLLPSLEDIEAALNSKDGRVPRRFTLFS